MNENVKIIKYQDKKELLFLAFRTEVLLKRIIAQLLKGENNLWKYINNKFLNKGKFELCGAQTLSFLHNIKKRSENKKQKLDYSNLTFGQIIIITKWVNWQDVYKIIEEGKTKRYFWNFRLENQFIKKLINLLVHPSNFQDKNMQTLINKRTSTEEFKDIFNLIKIHNKKIRYLLSKITKKMIDNPNKHDII